MIRPKGLGRGLDALLAGSDERDAATEALQTLADRPPAARQVSAAHADGRGGARRARGVDREQGVMQPILVRPVDGGRFEIIAGERRWRAAQRAGLTEVPALVKTVPDQSALALGADREHPARGPESARGGERPRAADRRIRPDARRGREGGRPLAQRGDQSAAPARAREAGAGVPDGGQARHGPCARAARAAGGAQTGAAARVVAQGLSVRETERLVHHLAHPGKARREARRARCGSRRRAARRDARRNARRESDDRAEGRTAAAASSSPTRASSSSTGSSPAQAA